MYIITGVQNQTTLNIKEVTREIFKYRVNDKLLNWNENITNEVIVKNATTQRGSSLISRNKSE
jgi:hypothetical protein